MISMQIPNNEPVTSERPTPDMNFVQLIEEFLL